ncbi:MAG TPA: DUF1800 family protein [Blastocatellia bacterium]|nr:DUF1800 family protein [Blastocatellia bacterium]
MLKREVWNNVFTPPRRNIRLLLFALVILIIASSVGELKKTQGQSSSTCNISYKQNTQWNVGFQGEFTISNSGPAINGWTVTFMFPTTTQTIYELWNGVYTQTGQTVTVNNASYNANIPTGGSVSFGFNANWSGSNPPPTSFTLNGLTCGATGPTTQTSVTTLSVNEGGSAQYGVRLSAAPASNVTVNVARLSGDTDLTVTGGATLTFTPANFNTFQMVTISAAEDADSTNGSAVFRASATGLPNADVTANEVDNDPANIPIQTSVATLNVNEGGSAQFGVRLASAPPATVTVTVLRLSGDTDLTASATLTFTAANFATFQNVTVSAAEDADSTNGTAVFRASGTNLTSADVTVSEVDNDPGIIPIQTSVTTLNVNEGGSAQFGVRLASAPPTTVTVNVARLSGDTDLTGSATLTFTAANFATFQNVTISAAEDADTTNGTAVFRASGTNLTSADVTVSEVENDTPVIPIQTSVTTLNVNEGGSAQFGVRLASAPPINVTVNVTRLSGDTDLTVTGGATLTFTPANFATFQNVTISAAEDGDMVNDTAVFRASGTNLTSADVNVTGIDNDVPISILTNRTRILPVIEGSTAQFGVRLASAPPSNVTVTVARLSGDTDLTVTGGATLTFTPANFATFQNVTISAAEDTDITNGTAMFRASGTGLTNAFADVSEFDNDGLPAPQRTFVATLNGASEVPPEITSATGSATVILSPDQTAALVSLSFANLSSAQTAAHIHGPAEPGNNAPGTILDLDQPLGQVSNLLWVFAALPGLTVQDQVNALKTGRLYVNVHTANFPSGEIRGWLFVVDDGSSTIPDTGSGGFADVARFLEQATFGPSVAEVNRVLGIGFEAYLNEQFAAPTSNYNNLVQLQQGTFVSYPVKLQFFRNAMTGQDQLRQRVAFALSQIVVAADIGNQDGTGNPTSMVSQYHDILTRNAFGNYRTLLREMSVSPIMGTYLTLVNSRRADPATNAQPDENYIRELWQLFTIGTFRLNPDGTVMLDNQGRPLETYTIATIQEGARALTGWNYAPAAGQPNLGDNNPLNPFAQMITNATNHDPGSKTLLNGQVIPAGQTVVQDLDSVIDNVFNHPNVGPFIGRQLIQHLVTSNPSPAYIARITAVFNNNGSGVRGDLRAVVRAILIDPEARGNSKTAPIYGKLREPALFLTHLFRALNCTGGMWGIPQRARTMGQDTFSPPSVFSFYQPDFRIIVNGQPVVSPPAQLLTTSTIIQRMNMLDNFLFSPPIQPGGDPNPTGSPTTSVVFDFAPWDQLAPNPTQLVDRLNEALMHNSMSAQMRQRVIDAVTSIQNNNRMRVQTAIYIIASSMQYQVQR